MQQWLIVSRGGALSAISLKELWRISTTGPCCAWTARRATARRTPSLVSQWEVGEESNPGMTDAVFALSHQSPVLCHRNCPKQRRIEQHGVLIQRLDELMQTRRPHRLPGTHGWTVPLFHWNKFMWPHVCPWRHVSPRRVLSPLRLFQYDFDQRWMIILYQ